MEANKKAISDMMNDLSIDESLDLVNFMISLHNIKSDTINQNLKSQFKVGDKVKINHNNGDETLGIIIKIMPKNIKVEANEYEHWTVSPNVLTLI